MLLLFLILVVKYLELKELLIIFSLLCNYCIVELLLNIVFFRV